MAVLRDYARKDILTHKLKTARKGELFTFNLVCR